MTGAHEKGRHRLRDDTQRKAAQKAREDAQSIIDYAGKVTHRRTVKPQTKAQKKARNGKEE